jgi:hypothetical protein
MSLRRAISLGSLVVHKHTSKLHFASPPKESRNHTVHRRHIRRANPQTKPTKKNPEVQKTGRLLYRQDSYNPIIPSKSLASYSRCPPIYAIMPNANTPAPATTRKVLTPNLPTPPVAEGEAPVVVELGLPEAKGSSGLLVAEGKAGSWVEAEGSGLSSVLLGFKTLHSVSNGVLNMRNRTHPSIT